MMYNIDVNNNNKLFMSDETKTKLISMAKTFGTSFVVASALIILDAETVSWTVAFWSSVAIAGLRAGVTAVIAPFIPVSLGGKKY